MPILENITDKTPITVTQFKYDGRDAKPVWKVDRKYTILTEYQKKRTGEFNPKWKQKLRQGLDASTPYSKETLSGLLKPTYFESTWAPPGYPWKVMYRGQMTLDPYNQPSVGWGEDINNTSRWTAQRLSCEALAALKVLNKIRQEEQSFSTPVILLELRKTIGMLRSPFKAFRGGLNDFISRARTVKSREMSNSRNGNVFKRREKAETALSDLYLEATFGWTPAVMDLQGIYETLINSRDNEIQRFRGYAEQRHLQSTESRTQGIGYEAEIRYIRTTSFITRSTFRCGYRVSALWDKTAVEKLHTMGGLRWQEIPAAAYEIIPWSFVWDYFNTLGDVLNASAVITKNIVWGNVTSEQKYSITDTNAVFRSKIPAVSGFIEGFTPQISERMLVTRTPKIPSVTLEAIQFRSPPLFSKPTLNMSALAISQLFSRR